MSTKQACEEPLHVLATVIRVTSLQLKANIISYQVMGCCSCHYQSTTMLNLNMEIKIHKWIKD